MVTQVKGVHNNVVMRAFRMLAACLMHTCCVLAACLLRACCVLDDEQGIPRIEGIQSLKSCHENEQI